ncbi:hypothetical protein N7482_007575, partial [Penicillium canariense]
VRNDYEASSLNSSTYDHRVWRTGLPVRSAVLKPHAGQLVVWWVTTCESWLFQDSHVVTHHTTNWPACGLSTAERTGSPVLHTLWSYVL